MGNFTPGSSKGRSPDAVIPIANARNKRAEDCAREKDRPAGFATVQQGVYAIARKPPKRKGVKRKCDGPPPEG